LREYCHAPYYYSQLKKFTDYAFTENYSQPLYDE